MVTKELKLGGLEEVKRQYWKTGEEFSNGYFTIEKYTSVDMALDNFKPTSLYLTVMPDNTLQLQKKTGKVGFLVRKGKKISF